MLSTTATQVTWRHHLLKVKAISSAGALADARRVVKEQAASASRQGLHATAVAIPARETVRIKYLQFRNLVGDVL
jgi:hypothetical protein